MDNSESHRLLVREFQDGGPATEKAHWQFIDLLVLCAVDVDVFCGREESSGSGY